MDATVSMGVTNKEMKDSSYYGCAPSPCEPCGSDSASEKRKWERTLNYPCFTVSGKHAELMGAEDLQVDDLVEVTMLLRVKGKRDDSRRSGDKVTRDICIDFEICKTSDLLDKGEDKNIDGKPDDEEVDVSNEPVSMLLVEGDDDEY